MAGFTPTEQAALLNQIPSPLWGQMHDGPAGPLGTAHVAFDARRISIAFAAAATIGGIVQRVNSALAQWTLVQTPTSDTPLDVTDVSLWTAQNAGTCIGRLPIGGFPYRACSVDATGDSFRSAGSGFGNGNFVEVMAEPGADPTLAGTGLVSDTRYFVVNNVGGTFQLSAAVGGAPVDVAVDCNVRVARALHRVVSAGGTVRIPAGQLALLL